MDRGSHRGRTPQDRLSLEERIQHRRKEDKIRQRNRRDRVKSHIDSLEAENDRLRQRVADLEARCDHLQGIVSSVATIVTSPLVDGREFDLSRPRLASSPASDVQAVTESHVPPAGHQDSLDKSPVQNDMVLAAPLMWPTWLAIIRDGPVWSHLPSHTPPSCPFDTMVSELDTLSQRLATQGLISIPEFESAAPAVSALVDLASSAQESLSPTTATVPSQTLSINNPHGFSLSNMLVDFVTMGMPALHTTLERLTATWAVFNLIRWRMCRSKEAFDALPPHYRPTRIQQSVSYPAWIDPIPWPQARDKIITQLPPSQYTRFRTMLHETYAIRAWSRPVYECLERSADGHWTLAPKFIQHLHDLRNVALTQKAVDEFPFLAGTVNIVPSADACTPNTDGVDVGAGVLVDACVDNVVPLFA